MRSAPAPAQGEAALVQRLQGLPPLVDARTVVLVLGSFPGKASLASGQYYAHPQNHFWPILEAIFDAKSAPGPRGIYVDSYKKRSKWLLAHGLGLWDVYGSCEREGSLDASIRKPVPNDFVALARRLPRLAAVAHNGGESFRHARHAQALGLPVYRLPSTSAANASWSFARKLAAWQEVMARHGLV